MTTWPERIRQIDDHMNNLRPSYECMDCGYQRVKRNDTHCKGCGRRIYWEPITGKRTPIAGEGGHSVDD
jgi:ribosomal protein L37AE/L43A